MPNTATASLTLRVNPPPPNVATKSFTLLVNALLAITTVSLPTGTVGSAYSTTLSATNGTTPYQWFITGLPAGVILNASTGVVSGTPTASGTFNISVTVNDSASHTATKTFTLTVNAASSTAPNGPTGLWNKVFDDEFSGTALNPNNWTAVNGANNSGVTTSSSKVSVSGGYCRLLMGGMICSNPVSGFPGPSSGPILAVGDCVEYYMNIPGPAGDTCYNWPAAWASGGNWPNNGEEDIVEGYNGTMSALNYHSPSGANNGPFPSGNWCNSFHTYTLVRGASSLLCYWDGHLVRSVTPNDAGGGQSLLVLIGSANTFSATAVTLVKYVRMWTPG